HMTRQKNTAYAIFNFIAFQNQRATHQTKEIKRSISERNMEAPIGICDDLVVEIARFLVSDIENTIKCLLVCKRWYNILTNSPILWGEWLRPIVVKSHFAHRIPSKVARLLKQAKFQDIAACKPRLFPTLRCACILTACMPNSIPSL